MTKPKRVIKSEALDAFMAKEEEARSRLGTVFVAFVQPVPRVAKIAAEKASAASRKRRKSKSHKKASEPRHVLGYAVYGVPEERGYLTTQNFAAFVAGNPKDQVQEIKTLLRELWEAAEDRLDVRDAHAARITSGLTAHLRYVLEDKDEAPGIGAEVLFVDFVGECVRWCSFDGAEASEPVSKTTKKLVLCGCYDKKVRRRVRSILRKHLQGSALPSKKDLKAMTDELKQATGMKRVGYNHFTQQL